MNFIKKFVNFVCDKFRCLCGHCCSPFKKCKHFKKGKIVLCHGFHKVGVGTCDCPLAVYLDVQEPCDGVTTCVGNLNWVVAKLDRCENEFTIFADVKTTSCTINYIVEY